VNELEDGGESLLRTIATAIVLLSRRQSPGDPVYEDGVQRAYNQLVLHCLRSGAEPPASVPDMVRWAARTPLQDWPVSFAAADLKDAPFLVDEQTCTPTQSCMEWALTVADAPAELFEREIIEAALAACRSARSPASYTAFRKLLITRPVMTAAELAALAADIDLMPVFETIRRSYEPAAAAYLRDGAYQLCGRCGCLLVPLKTGGYRCELDRCRSDGQSVPGRVLPAQAGVLELKRPLRMFITSPGIAETDLEVTLRSFGLAPEMWPEFDAYDLRVPFPGGAVWAVDVKDWANPSLLARTTRMLRAESRHDRAFIVVPGYRLRVREDYARAFRHHLAPEFADSIELCSDAELASLARRELGRTARGRNAHA
jgi:pPIWI_RE three-gene island domain Y/REase associating with pPIWI_RE